MFASVFVLVGDHYQLPPLVQVSIVSTFISHAEVCPLNILIIKVHALIAFQSTEARENGLGISLFCRLSEAHPQAISALQSQVSC